MKRIITLSVLLCSLWSTMAQREASTDTLDTYASVKGDFSLAVLFGRGNFFQSNLWAPQAPFSENGKWTVSGQPPYADMIEPNYNDATNMVGIEGRYFLKTQLALKISGGAIIRDTPSRMNVESFTDFDNENNQTWIPNYESVKSDERIDLNFNLGAEYHFESRFDRVSPYIGITIPFYYARRSVYDPSIITVDEEPVIMDIGERHTEVFGVGAQLVGGVDFHLLEGLYIGAEFKPVSYLYAYSAKSPGPGFEHLEASTQTFSFFGQTYLKLGFKF